MLRNLCPWFRTPSEDTEGINSHPHKTDFSQSSDNKA